MGLLDVMYRDEDLVVVNKPEALLVHRTRQSGDHVAALQLVRDQLGQKVYPAHRLDRATSGLLVFGLNPAAARALGAAFTEHRVHKTYRAIVRGRCPAEGLIDHPVCDSEELISREAKTRFRLLKVKELDAVVEKRPGVYSLVEVYPETGRRHQIRKHMKHIGHPLIGDTTYGRGVHNRYFRDTFGMYRLLLHARCIELPHPATQQPLRIEISETSDASWRALYEQWDWLPKGSGYPDVSV